MTTETESRDRPTLDVDKINPEDEYTSSHGKLGDKKLSLDRRKVEADLQKSMQRQAHGAIGRIVGDKDHAPTNVVALCLILLITTTGILAIVGSEALPAIFDITRTVLVAAMGYFAGVRSRPHHPLER